MAGHSPSKTGVNALLSRPFTSFRCKKEDVDARHKAEHDGKFELVLYQKA
jgi:hypothetical protein